MNEGVSGVAAGTPGRGEAIVAPLPHLRGASGGGRNWGEAVLNVSALLLGALFLLAAYPILSQVATKPNSLRYMPPFLIALAAFILLGGIYLVARAVGGFVASFTRKKEDAGE